MRRFRELWKRLEELESGGGTGAQTVEVASQTVAPSTPFYSDEIVLEYGKIHVVEFSVGAVPRPVASGASYAGPYAPDTSRMELLGGPGVLQSLYDNGSLPQLDGGAFSRGFGELEPTAWFAASWLVLPIDINARVQIFFNQNGTTPITYEDAVLKVQEL